MEALLTETVTEVRPASRSILEARLRGHLEERELRKAMNVHYGQSISDSWLEADIATLERALQEVKQQ